MFSQVILDRIEMKPDKSTFSLINIEDFQVNRMCQYLSNLANVIYRLLSNTSVPFYFQDEDQ